MVNPLKVNAVPLIVIPELAALIVIVPPDGAKVTPLPIVNVPATE